MQSDLFLTDQLPTGPQQQGLRLVLFRFFNVLYLFSEIQPNLSTAATLET